jgi:hypothetical protein
VKTQDEYLEEAASAFADELLRLARMTPREMAEAVWMPGGPTVDELTAQITAERAELWPAAS